MLDAPFKLLLLIGASITRILTRSMEIRYRSGKAIENTVFRSSNRTIAQNQIIIYPQRDLVMNNICFRIAFD